MNQLDLARTRFCACGNLRSATRALTQFYDELLQPSGLKTTQFTLLVTVARFGPVSITQLGKQLQMDQTTVTRNLQPLEEKQLLQRVIGEDQRTRFLSVTEQGQQVLEKAFPLWEQAQTQIVEGLGQEHFRAILKELAAMAALTR